jgi:integrase
MRKHEATVNELMDRVERDYRINDRKSLRTQLIHIAHVRRLLGDRSAVRLKTDDIEEYKDKRKEEQAANQTINNELSALGAGYTLAEIKDRPEIRKLEVHNVRKGFFEHQEYLAQLAALPEYLKNVFRFGYKSGWRKGEILPLEWELNYEGAILRIFDSKNDEGRVLPLVGELKEIIHEQLAARVPGCPYIFHRNGKKIANSTFDRDWLVACAVSQIKKPAHFHKKSGTTPCTNPHFHDLRRTRVRNFRRAGVSQTEAMKITGHKTLSVFERYNITNEKDIEEALLQSEAWFHASQNSTEIEADDAERLFNEFKHLLEDSESNMVDQKSTLLAKAAELMRKLGTNTRKVHE